MVSFLCNSPSSPPLRHVPYIVYDIHDLCCDQPWINHHNGHAHVDHHLNMSICHKNEEDRDEEDRDKWDRPEMRSRALVGFFCSFFSLESIYRLYVLQVNHHHNAFIHHQMRKTRTGSRRVLSPPGMVSSFFSFGSTNDYLQLDYA
jgi:hypothetical protein